MKRTDKRLAKAIALGLVLSSAFTGSAWAKTTINAPDKETGIKNVILPSDNGTYTALGEGSTAIVFNSFAETDNTSITLNTDQEISVTAIGGNQTAYGMQSSVSNNAADGISSVIDLSSKKDVTISGKSDSKSAHGIVAGSGDVFVNADGVAKVSASSSGTNGIAIIAGATHGTSSVEINSQNNTVEATYAGIYSYTDTTTVTLNANSNQVDMGNNIINSDQLGIVAWAMYAPQYDAGHVILDASNDNIITAGRIGAYSVDNKASIRMTAGNNNEITADRYSVYANDKGTVQLTATENNNLDSKDIGIYTDNDGSAILDAKNNSIIAPTVVSSLNGGSTTITATDTNTLTGNLSAATNGQITTTSTNATKLVGDARNEGGTITLNMGTGSQWDGKSTLQDTTDEATQTTYHAVTDATMAAGSIWNMTDSSQLTTLDATNSTINMYGNAKKLTMETLSGSGNKFQMDLKYLGDGKTVADYQDSDETDFVTVTKSSSGSNTLVFKPTGDNVGAMSNTDQKLYFAQMAGSATFDMDSATAVDASNAYNHEYKVKSEEEGSNKNWYIGLEDKPTPDPVDPVDPVDPDPDQPGVNVDVTRGTMLADYALGTEMDRLNKRLGESRYLEDEKGLYVRYRHNHVGYDNAFKTKGNMFQLGYDKQRIEKDGTHYRGGAFDYTHGTTSFNNAPGHGEHDRYGVSLYDTWIGNKGHYYDLVIRGGQLRSDFDVYNEVDQKINSNYHRNFASISGEYGRKLDGQKGWYFEPQAQFQLARIGSADYTTNHGVRVEQDGATSAIARGGFRLGRQTFDADGNKANNYYFKADVMHEFAGKQSFTVTGKDGVYRETDTHDTWYDIGVGADIKLKKGRYFWADLERTFGGDYDTTWQVNGGFRWEF